MMMVGSLVALFASLVVGSIGAGGAEALRRASPATPSSRSVIAVGVSRSALFVFLASAYYVLTNAT